MSIQNTISGKEFCKINCGNVGKEKFHEEYYRILHTAYLRADKQNCIDVIKNDFETTFGSNLNDVSISYIYATSKYFVYDVIVNSLLKDGKIESQYYFNKLAIDLGFDVWLIDSVEKSVRMTMNDFLAWQPLPKTDKTERAINDFWHFRLPKSHNFGHLYSGIAPYKKRIFEIYRKLLIANTNYETDPNAYLAILNYLNNELDKINAESKKNAIEAAEAILEENKEETEQKFAEIVEEVTLSDAVSTIEAETEDKETVAPTANEQLADLIEEASKSLIESENAAENVTEDSEPIATDESEQAITEAEETTEQTEEEISETVDTVETVAEEAATEQAVVEVVEETVEEAVAGASEETTEESDQIIVTDADETPVESEEKSEDKIVVKVVETKRPPIFEAVAPHKNRYIENDKSRVKTENVKGFKSGALEFTKNKAVTAAVCVTVASVLAIPLAVAFLGKGRRK